MGETNMRIATKIKSVGVLKFTEWMPCYHLSELYNQNFRNSRFPVYKVMAPKHGQDLPTVKGGEQACFGVRMPVGLGMKPTHVM